MDDRKPQFDSVQVTLTKAERYRRAAMWLPPAVVCGIVGALSTFESGFKGIGFIGAAVCVVTAILVAREATVWQITELGISQKVARRLAQRRTVETAFKTMLALAATVALIYWLSVPVADYFAGRVTVYEENCVPGARCVLFPPKTFHVHVDQQLVILTSEDVPVPHKLSNCVVADRANWSCLRMPLPDYSSRLTMKDGDYSETDTVDTVRYVPRYQWILDKLN